MNSPDKKKKEREKRVRLLIHDKLKILEELKTGASERMVAKQYCIHRRSIFRLKKIEETLNDFESSSIDAKKRKSIRQPKHRHVGAVLFKWMSQAREMGISITGPLLREKAMIINEKVGGPEDFKASIGWLGNFRKRHGITQLSLHGETLPADVQASEKFVEDFTRRIEMYKRENVYNADETGINWRDLPDEIVDSGSEKSCAGNEVTKDRITILICANASGTHQLPILVIGKSTNPRCLENAEMLPVVYRSQSAACIDKRVFMDWYKNHFIPCIKERQTVDGVTGKVLLLLDNAPAHPAAEYLNAVDNDVSVVYLPANVNSLVQPMNRGIIEQTKRLYRKELLRSLLLNEDLAKPDAIAKKLDLTHCCNNVASAFVSLPAFMLKAAWEKFIPIRWVDSKKNLHKLDVQETLQIIRDTFYQIPAFRDYPSEEFTRWLDQDRHDPGWQIPEFDELIQGIAPFYFVDVQTDYEKPVPSDESFMNAANIVIDWCKTNSNYDAVARNNLIDAVEKLKKMITSHKNLPLLST